MRAPPELHSGLVDAALDRNPMNQHTSDCARLTTLDREQAMGLTSYGVTDAGCVRSENQDRVLFDDQLGLYLVCDGLGGRGRGEFAAETATGAIREYVRASKDPREITWPFGYSLDLSCASNRLLTAVKLANRQVWRHSEENLAFLGMGTTVSGLLIDGGAAAIVNLGDSRVYLVRDQAITQLTVDDTIAAQAGLHGARLTTPEDLPVQKILTRAAGSNEVAELESREIALREGDVLLLCSDGLHAAVSENEMLAVMSRGAGSPRDSAMHLLDSAKAAGAPDNVAVVVVAYS